MPPASAAASGAGVSRPASNASQPGFQALTAAVLPAKWTRMTKLSLKDRARLYYAATAIFLGLAVDAIKRVIVRESM